ncbi:MD-2-related lipid-recognition protein-like [Pseudomyrmex gracilis]|uniref:MD-2-related lipid-recognition protein-like n=1 Tax=Pseudomyrmex gracilis TaxID=219809 RepID=UPI000994F84D|nr:MD-2-related lipid-recognition protein-like [Pseudomyrmex gracilis]
MAREITPVNVVRNPPRRGKKKDGNSTVTNEFLGGGDTSSAHLGSVAIKPLSQLTSGPTTTTTTTLSRFVISDEYGLTLTAAFFHLTTNHRSPKMNRNIVLAALVLSVVYAEVVHFTSCPPDPDVVEACTVNEVRVDPCREAEERKPCGLKKGRNASISFDFTPEFGGEYLETRAYWASEVVDLPFLGMSSNACESTTCPATPNQKQTYSVILPISKKFPMRTYNLKWKLWNEQRQHCCFMFPIKLLK